MFTYVFKVVDLSFWWLFLWESMGDNKLFMENRCFCSKTLAQCIVVFSSMRDMPADWIHIKKNTFWPPFGAHFFNYFILFMSSFLERWVKLVTEFSVKSICKSSKIFSFESILKTHMLSLPWVFRFSPAIYVLFEII